MSAAALQNHRVPAQARGYLFSLVGRRTLSGLLPILFLALSAAAAADGVGDAWKTAATSQAAVIAYDLKTSKEIFSKGSDKLLKPASVLKLVTAAAALNRLGADFTFTTDFLYSPKNGGVLFVKGGGDPSLTTEDLFVIAQALKNRGLSSVKKIVLDTSMQAAPIQRAGGRAYEAAPSAVALNYNSVAIAICPDVMRKQVLVHVNPEIPGLTLKNSVSFGSQSEISIGEVTDLKGSVLVSGIINKKDDACIVRYRSVPDPEAYFGTVLKGIVSGIGLGDPSVEEALLSGEGELLYTHRSKPLSWIVHGMNHFSTNVLAESLLYQLGCKENKNCSRERGLEALADILKESGVEKSDFHLEDGSGLSHANRITARALLTLVRWAFGNPRIAAEFESSLSIGGESGTLKRRPFKASEVFLRGKTGSLDGVSTLAGLVYTQKGNRIAFVVLQNDIVDKEKAEALEERVVHALYEYD